MTLTPAALAKHWPSLFVDSSNSANTSQQRRPFAWYEQEGRKVALTIGDPAEARAKLLEESLANDPDMIELAMMAWGDGCVELYGSNPIAAVASAF